MLNAGFQYLEQRDSSDNIVKPGVVSKKTAFATSDNAGIYDVIAEDLRVLYEAVQSEKLTAITAAVTAMYNDMKTNPNFGSTSAAASAADALASKNAAATSEVNARGSENNAAASASAATTAATTATTDLTSITAMLTQIQTYVKMASDSQTVAQTQATAAITEASLSKAWAESIDSPDGTADTSSSTGKSQSSKSWALSAKMSETNAASAAGKCQGIVDDAAATLAAAISKISQLIVDCGDTSEIPVQIDIGDAVYPTTICALSATQPETGTQLWIEKE
jgi:hypothetical protein